jgi:hypothetical protein
VDTSPSTYKIEEKPFYLPIADEREEIAAIEVIIDKIFRA